MSIFNLSLKIIGQIIFVIIFFTTAEAKNLNKFNAGENISDYFSGILLLNNNQYNESFRFLKKLNDLEKSHHNYSIKYLYSLVNSGNLNEAFNYSTKYLYTLINSGNFNEAFSYSKKLEKRKLDNFESNLISGIFYLKNSNFDRAKKYFLKAKNINSTFVLNNYVSNSLYNLSNLENLNLGSSIIEIKKLDKRFENLKKIQSVFLNCFFNSPNTTNLFDQLTLNNEVDFSRYSYFYASHVASSGKINEAKNIVQSALKLHPRNLLLNQYKIDLKEEKNINIFSI